MTRRQGDRSGRLTALRGLLRGLVLVLVAAIGVTAWPAPAQAHTELIGSTPGADDRVAMSTDLVSVSFSEELLPGASAVVVRGPDGTDVAQGKPSTVGNTVEAGIAPERPGRHTLSYRVIGADGHAVVGELAFRVAAGEARPRPATAAGVERPRVSATMSVPRTSASGPDNPLPWVLLTAAFVGALVAVLAISRRKPVDVSADRRPRSG